MRKRVAAAGVGFHNRSLSLSLPCPILPSFLSLFLPALVVFVTLRRPAPAATSWHCWHFSSRLGIQCPAPPQLGSLPLEGFIFSTVWQDIFDAKLELENNGVTETMQTIAHECTSLCLTRAVSDPEFIGLEIPTWIHYQRHYF